MEIFFISKKTLPYIAAFFLLGSYALCPGDTPKVVPEAVPASSENEAYAEVHIPKVSTSIYVGSVSLTTTVFMRVTDHTGSGYTADYKASVTPLFFYNETGSLRITFTDEQLAALDRGDRVEFTGEGKNKSGSLRTITGHATPDAPHTKTGKIKVRVYVTKKTALIFNTTYTFVEKSRSAE